MNYVDDEFKQLTPREQHIFKLLEEMVDHLYTCHVDVSYFPKIAEMVLIKYAKKFNELNDG